MGKYKFSDMSSPLLIQHGKHLLCFSHYWMFSTRSRHRSLWGEKRNILRITRLHYITNTFMYILYLFSADSLLWLYADALTIKIYEISRSLTQTTGELVSNVYYIFKSYILCSTWLFRNNDHRVSTCIFGHIVHNILALTCLRLGVSKLS